MCVMGWTVTFHAQAMFCKVPWQCSMIPHEEETAHTATGKPLPICVPVLRPLFTCVLLTSLYKNHAHGTKLPHQCHEQVGRMSLQMR